MKIKHLVLAFAISQSSLCWSQQSALPTDCSANCEPVKVIVQAKMSLKKLDASLAKLQSALSDHYLSKDDQKTIADQHTAWLGQLFTCGSDEPCIKQSYARRKAYLSGKNPSAPLSGLFASRGNGSVVLYPLQQSTSNPQSQIYLAQIQSVDRVRAKWTCELSGNALYNNKKLIVMDKGKQASFDIEVESHRRLQIKDTDQVRAVSSTACGLNGTFSFRYVRESM